MSYVLFTRRDPARFYGKHAIKCLLDRKNFLKNAPVFITTTAYESSIDIYLLFFLPNVCVTTYWIIFILDVHGHVHGR